jgi:hypothetical protein
VILPSGRALQVWVRWRPGVRHAVGRLARHQGRILFEFDRGWLGNGVELSPLHLPPQPGVHPGPAQPFA